MNDHVGKVTRDADFPPEIAQLFQAFNRCSEGSDTGTVLEAAANFLIAAILYHAQASDFTRAQAATFAHRIGANLQGHVITQWDRSPQPSDILVPNGSS